MQANSAIRVIMIVRILLCSEHWRRGSRLPSAKQFSSAAANNALFTCR